MKLNVSKQPEPIEPKIRIKGLPDELKPPTPPPVENNMRMKITNKQKPERKLVVQFRNKNGVLQVRKPDAKNWIRVNKNKPTKLDGKIVVSGFDEYQKQMNAVAKQGPKGDPGEDGASVELRKTNNWIEWKQEDEKKWKKLVSLNELQGEPGKDGVTTVIGGSGGGVPSDAVVQSVVAGDNVTVDNTDPKNPIVSVIIPPDAGVMVIQAGDNIIVDSTVPASPIIHAVMPSAYLLTGMFTNDDADISGYKYASPLTTFVEQTEGTTTVPVDTNPTIIEEFASRVNNPGISLIVAGIATVHYDTQKSSGTDNYYTYAEIYKRSRAGVETLLFTTDQSTTTNHNERQSITVTAPNPNNIPLNIRDRIVAKIYAVMESGTADIAIFYDGASGSRLVYPTIISDSTAFVAWGDVLDEDNMASNSADHVPTQQSVKAYVDSQVATVNSLAELSDVDFDALNPNQYLNYTGTGWINDYLHWADIIDIPTFSDVATGGAYSDLDDVTVAGLGDDYIMAWDNDLSQWTPRSSAPSAGSIAWGAITGTITAQTDLLAAFVRTTGSANQTITGTKTFSSAIQASAGVVSGSDVSITGTGMLKMDNNPSGNAYLASWDSNMAFGGSSSDTGFGNNYTATIWAKGLGGWQHPYMTLTGLNMGYWESGPGIFFVSSVATNFRRYGIIGNADGSSISGLAFGSHTNQGTTFTEQLRLTMDAVGASNSVLDFKTITKIINLVDPTNPQDGATKNYVDDAIVGASGGIDGVEAGTNISVDTTDPSNPIINTILTPVFDTATVDADPYDAGWDGDLTVPTKDDLFTVLGDIEAALDEILG